MSFTGARRGHWLRAGVFCLGLFLLTPLAMRLMKGVGWTLVAVGILLAAIGAWMWWKSR